MMNFVKFPYSNKMKDFDLEISLIINIENKILNLVNLLWYKLVKYHSIHSFYSLNQLKIVLKQEKKSMD
jgi:hypothetical protein